MGGNWGKVKARPREITDLTGKRGPAATRRGREKEGDMGAEPRHKKNVLCHGTKS